MHNVLNLMEYTNNLPEFMTISILVYSVHCPVEEYISQLHCGFPNLLIKSIKFATLHVMGFISTAKYVCEPFSKNTFDLEFYLESKILQGVNTTYQNELIYFRNSTG